MRLWPFTRSPNQSSPAPRDDARFLWRAELDDRGLRLSSGSIDAPKALLDSMVGLVSDSRVERSVALRASAVLRARNLISGVCATLPLELRDRDRNLVEDRTWLGEQPDPNVEPVVTFALTFEDLLFDAKSYWLVTKRHSDGFPVEARHVNLSSVSQHAVLGLPSQNVSPDHHFSAQDPIYIDGVEQDPRDIIRFLSPLPPFLTYAARHIRQVLLLDAIAAGYAEDPLPFGYFTDADDQGQPEEDTLTDPEVEELLAKWEQKRRAHRWGYVPSSLNLKQLEWPTPADLQLNEARDHAVMEIARDAGLDPEDMGVQIQGGSRTYVNAEQRRLDLVDFNLVTLLTAVQQRLSMPDVTPSTLKARYDVSAFTRADFKSRMQAGKIGVESKIHTVNEMRRKEWEPDLPESELKPQPPPQQQPPPREPVGSGANGNGSNGNGRG